MPALSGKLQSSCHLKLRQEKRRFGRKCQTSYRELLIPCKKLLWKLSKEAVRPEGLQSFDEEFLTSRPTVFGGSFFVPRAR
jgi:hypothetical protein